MSDIVAFSTIITTDDKFLSLPVTAQMLYFHLGMDTDKHGNCIRPKAIMRMIGATDTDMATLVRNGFVKQKDGDVQIVGAGGLDDG